MKKQLKLKQKEQLEQIQSQIDAQKALGEEAPLVKL